MKMSNISKNLESYFGSTSTKARNPKLLPVGDGFGFPSFFVICNDVP